MLHISKWERQENASRDKLGTAALNLCNVAKRKNLNFITGHVISGRTAKFKGNISLIENVHNWQGTGLTFEYYRRIL